MTHHQLVALSSNGDSEQISPKLPRRFMRIADEMIPKSFPSHPDAPFFQNIPPTISTLSQAGPPAAAYLREQYKEIVALLDEAQKRNKIGRETVILVRECVGSAVMSRHRIAQMWWPARICLNICLGRNTSALAPDMTGRIDIGLWHIWNDLSVSFRSLPRDPGYTPPSSYCRRPT